MLSTHRWTVGLAAITVAVLPLAAAPSKADPAVGVAVVAPLTPLTLGVGTGATIVGHELFQRRPFGHNG